MFLVEMEPFYFDVLEGPALHSGRRSGRRGGRRPNTAIWRIARRGAGRVAPIMSLPAEEAGSICPPSPGEYLRVCILTIFPETEE